MTVRTILLFTIVLLVSLAFGGLVHAMLPHNHSHTAVSDLMHAAVRHNEQKFVILPTFLLLVAAILPVITVVTHRRLSLMSLVIRSGSAEMHGLRSGILPHRRFG